MDSPTILVIDDSEQASQTVRRVLEGCSDGYRVITASEGLLGLRTLLSTRVDLVLCDLVMEGVDGLKFLGLKAERAELADIPVIMLTSSSRVAEKVKALEQGAADYLLKPFDDAELIARVRVHLKVRFLQRELREKNERLTHLSNTDELTQLANRRHFMQLAELEVLRAQRYRNPLCCILTDLDHFKSVNDKHGHLAGDQVLREVGRVIQQNLRRVDIAARYGGEEIIFLLPQTPREGGVAVSERYRAQIAALDISIGQKSIAISASFGVAAYDGAGPLSLDQLIARADRALYAAKRAGRNRVCAMNEDLAEHGSAPPDAP